MAEGRKESTVKDNRAGSASTRGRAARLAARRKAIRRKRIILAFSTVVVLALVVLVIFSSVAVAVQVPAGEQRT